MIDPRTLRPLDLDTILESVRKTNRVVIVEEGWPHGGVGANLAALIQEQAFDYLDAPVQRVTGADVPMPYSKRLEQSAIPHPEHVVSAVLRRRRACERAIAGSEAKRGNMADVVMPRLSDSMEEGTVLAWMKSVGDEVAVGDELVEIETDKANMVYESDVAGTLIEILADEGATLPIGEVIARVGDRRGPRPANGAADGGARRQPEEQAEAEAPADEAARSRRAAEPASAPAAASGDGAGLGERIKASPLARRIAARAGRRSRGA